MHPLFHHLNAIAAIYIYFSVAQRVESKGNQQHELPEFGNQFKTSVSEDNKRDLE